MLKLAQFSPRARGRSTITSKVSSESSRPKPELRPLWRLSKGSERNGVSDVNRYSCSYTCKWRSVNYYLIFHSLMKAMPSLILSVEKELPVHHKLEELLDHYLKASGLEKEPGSPLFPASIGKTAKLSRRPLARTDAADMLKRRLNQAGLPAHYSPHSFRATGITNFLEDDGTLEAAQRIAGHADTEPQNFTTAAARRFCSRIWRGFDTNNWTTETVHQCRQRRYLSVTVTKTKRFVMSSIQISNRISVLALSPVGQTNRLRRVHNGSQKLSPH